MAKITNRRLGELLQHLFRVLEQYPDGLKAREALLQLEKTIELTEHESGNYESGRRFEKIVRFATVDTVRAGWLIKDSGTWMITDDGIMALKNWPDPLDFHKEASRLYRKWRKESKTGIKEQTGELIETDFGDNEIGEEDERDTSVTFEQAEDQARADIESFLDTMPPYDFQHLVADLLRAMDYFVEWIAPPGRDGGVDIIAHTDPLGTQGPRIKVQVKRQQQSVGLPDLKSFVANIGQLDSGIFVCTGGFTKDAAEYARNHESKRIMLINTDKLVKLWIEFTPKLSDRARKRLPLTPIHFLTPQG